MERLLNIGDVTAFTRNKRVRGVLNKDSNNESFETFVILHNIQDVKVLDYHKADDRTCSGWNYDVEVLHKGKVFIIEDVSQFDLVSVKEYQYSKQLNKRI